MAAPAPALAPPVATVNTLRENTCSMIMLASPAAHGGRSRPDALADRLRATLGESAATTTCAHKTVAAAAAAHHTPAETLGTGGRELARWCTNGCKDAYGCTTTVAAHEDACPSCRRPLCKACQQPGTACIRWLEREGLGDALANTCEQCGAVGCAECLRQCQWEHADNANDADPGPTAAPMLCARCADASGVVRVPCDDHYWFICAAEHNFGDENWDDATDERGDMATYCSICGANANYCAKMGGW